MANYFPSNIRFLRKLHKMNQTEFGKIISKTYGTISMWESGDREPTIEDVFLLSQHFKIPMTDLYSVDLRTVTHSSLLSEEELQLLEAFAQLTSTQQQIILNTIKEMIREK